MLYHGTSSALSRVRHRLHLESTPLDTQWKIPMRPSISYEQSSVCIRSCPARVCTFIERSPLPPLNDRYSLNFT